MTNIEEIWKDIDGFPNYEVSNLAQIRSLKTGRIIKLGKRRKYRYIKLFIDGERNYLLIHRVVAMHFIPNPENKPLVCHIDNDPTNNRFDNLYWGTHKENTQQAHRDGLCPDRSGIPNPDCQGEKHVLSKLTNLQVSVIKEALRNDHSLTRIGRYFKITKGTVWKIKAGYTWQCVS